MGAGVQRGMDQGFRLREATAEDADVLADVHTRTRTAYYTAGGMPEEELADPSAWGERRDAWARVLGAPARATVVAEDLDGTAVGLLTAGPPHHEDLDASTYYELYQIGVLAMPGVVGWVGPCTGSSLRWPRPLAVPRACWSAGHPTPVRSDSTPETGGGRMERAVQDRWTMTTSGLRLKLVSHSF